MILKEADVYEAYVNQTQLDFISIPEEKTVQVSQQGRAGEKATFAKLCNYTI